MILHMSIAANNIHVKEKATQTLKKSQVRDVIIPLNLGPLWWSNMFSRPTFIHNLFFMPSMTDCLH